MNKVKELAQDYYNYAHENDAFGYIDQTLEEENINIIDGIITTDNEYELKKIVEISSGNYYHLWDSENNYYGFSTWEHSKFLKKKRGLNNESTNNN